MGIKKEELRNKLYQYCEDINIVDVETKNKRLSAFINRYNEGLSFEENVIFYLNQLETDSSYKNAKSVIKAFSEYLNIKVDFNNIKFQQKYITFRDIIENIDYVETNKLWLIDDETSAYFTNMKLYVYLLWIGASKKEISTLFKKDYDTEKRILNVDNRSYDLKTIYYSEYNVGEIVHKELVRCINSAAMVKYEGLTDYVSYSSAKINMDEKLMLNSRKSIRSANAAAQLAKKYIASSSVIHTSGVMSRLAIWEKLNDETINKYNIDKAIIDIKSSLQNGKNLITLYNAYKTFIGN